LILSQLSNADVFYFNDFENTSNPLTEWANNVTETTPGTISHPSDRFLGRFWSDTGTLTLSNLPIHSEITISFDLYIIQTWDGSSYPSVAPDVWDLTVNGGPTLVHATFTNYEENSSFRQSYPDPYPDGDYPARTGAAENNILGYPSNTGTQYQDSIYHIERTFSHSSDSIQFLFSGILTQPSGTDNINDESWGLDNVTVTPEPATLFLLTLGGLILRRK